MGNGQGWNGLAGVGSRNFNYWGSNFLGTGNGNRGYGNGYGGYGYGNGYGNQMYGNGSGIYVLVYVPGLGWVLMPLSMVMGMGGFGGGFGGLGGMGMGMGAMGGML